MEEPKQHDPIIWRPELRKALGNVCSETIRAWMKSGKLPPPDVRMSMKTMGWKLSTLRGAGIDISV